MDDTVDLYGRAYASYRSANMYKKALVAGCQCRPDPWSVAELARHEQYADVGSADRAKAHVAAVKVVLADAGVTPVAAPSAITAKSEPAAGTDVAAVLQPVPVAKPTKTAAKAQPTDKSLRRNSVPTRIAQGAKQPAGLFNTGMGLGGSGLTWPGDTPKSR